MPTSSTITPTPNNNPYAKIPCTKCSQLFRGQHELKRHTGLKHPTQKTFWICIDGSKTGARHTDAVKPVVPFEDCKHCSEGKRYGAYYNAAAHLRRAHFFPAAKHNFKTKREDILYGRPRGRFPSADLPRMEWLKTFWFKPVVEDADGNMVDAAPKKHDVALADEELPYHGAPIVMSRHDKTLMDFNSSSRSDFASYPSHEYDSQGNRIEGWNMSDGFEVQKSDRLASSNRYRGPLSLGNGLDGLIWGEDISNGVLRPKHFEDNVDKPTCNAN